MLVMLRKKALDNGLQDSNIYWRRNQQRTWTVYFLVSYWWVRVLKYVKSAGMVLKKVSIVAESTIHR
jgi:hypothetical protein